ncbi:MAG: hypothetical protein LW701_07390 [Fluviicola sp.]|nr:hypothetical protein [Fluviicola sp.]
MSKFNSILFLTFSLFLTNSFGQKTTIDNVLNIKSAKQTGEIIENQKLVGYFVFYFKEKVDKNNCAYEVSIFDDNFKPKKDFEIIRPKNTSLLETVYNGSCFLLYFYDNKAGLELVTYDKTGKKLGSDNIPFTKNKKTGYELVAYDNEMKKLWDISSPETSKLLESIEITEVNDEFITATIVRKKSAMTREAESACTIINAEDGTSVCELALGSEKTGKRSMLNSTYMSKDESFLLIGEYFKPGDDILKDKSQGIYVQKLDRSGKEISLKEFKWKGSIDKFKQENIDEEDKKDADKPFYIFFHDVIVSDNGHVFLIGEQFKRQISAGAIAGKMAVAALGGQSNASSFEIRVANMVLIELDETLNMVDFDLIKKKKTSVLLPQGAGLWNIAFLGYYINSIGGFDYRFTSRNKENDQYSVVFSDFDRKEENSKSKADCMLGVIEIKKGTTSNKRVPINTDAKTWWINPAKPGYIAIGEYYRKERKLDYHLEPLSY